MLEILLGKCSRHSRRHLDRYYEIWREWSSFRFSEEGLYNLFDICTRLWQFSFFPGVNWSCPHTDHHQFNDIQHRLPMTCQGSMHHATAVCWGKRLVQNTLNCLERSAKIMNLWQKYMVFNRSVTLSSRFDRKRLGALVTVKMADDFKSMWRFLKITTPMRTWCLDRN